MRPLEVKWSEGEKIGFRYLGQHQRNSLCLGSFFLDEEQRKEALTKHFPVLGVLRHDVQHVFGLHHLGQRNKWSPQTLDILSLRIFVTTGHFQTPAFISQAHFRSAYSQSQTPAMIYPVA